MKNRLLRFLRDRHAVTSLEYALLAALIAVVIVGTVTTAGSALVQLYDHVKDQVVLAMQ